MDSVLDEKSFQICTYTKKTFSYVSVEFFGDHSQSLVEANNCLLYSNRLPGRRSKNEDYKQAVEVRQYHSSAHLAILLTPEH